MKTRVNLNYNNELRIREIQTRRKYNKMNTQTLTHIQTLAIDAPLEYILNLTPTKLSVIQI